MAEKDNRVAGIIDRLTEITTEFNQLTKENEELKQKIMKNVELLSEAENVIKNLKDHVSFLETQKKSDIPQLPPQVNILRRELEEKENALKYAHNIIKERENEISIMKLKVSTSVLSDQSQLNNFRQEFLQKNSQIAELTNLNNELRNQIKKLEAAKVITEAPTPVVETSASLNVLCKDLQDKLNISKKYTERLEADFRNLKSIQGQEAALERITELENKNDRLLQKLKELESVQLTSKDPNKILELEEQLKEKETIILQLDSKQTEASTTVSSGVEAPAGLIEDLQKKINKLKSEVKKKDEMISKLRS